MAVNLTQNKALVRRYYWPGGLPRWSAAPKWRKPCAQRRPQTGPV